MSTRDKYLRDFIGTRSCFSSGRRKMLEKVYNFQVLVVAVVVKDADSSTCINGTLILVVDTELDC